MNRNIRILGLLGLFVSLLLGSCRSDYTQMVESEAKNPTPTEDLYFGFKVGQNRKQFFDRCWELNKMGKVTKGPNNKTVQHTFETTKEGQTSIVYEFYGIFTPEQLMTGLDMGFYLEAWAPWNTDLYAEKLIPQIKDSLVKWYPGNEFKSVYLKELDREVWIKIDGSRQILLYPKNEKEITAKLEDLRYKYPEIYE